MVQLILKNIGGNRTPYSTERTSPPFNNRKILPYYNLIVVHAPIYETTLFFKVIPNLECGILQQL